MKSKSIKRLIDNVINNDKSIFGFCALFTLVATIYPLFGVLLPRLLIGELTSAAPTLLNVIYIVAGYLICAGIFGYLKTFINEYSQPKMTLLRINYVKDTAEKLINMRYPNVEDSQFSDKYTLAFESTSSNDNGVEGIYRKLFELPSLLLTICLLAVFVGLLSPYILIASFIHIAVTFVVTRKSQKYAYAKKEVLGKARKKVSYYYNSTQDFAYGKDIRLYGLKDIIIQNYHTEIVGYANARKLIANREFGYGFLSLLTLLLSDAVTYGILIYLTVNGMSIAEFSMYLTAVLTLSLTLKTLSENISFTLNEKMYVDDLFRFLDEDMGDKGGPVKAVERGQTLDIEFKDVTFRYPNTERNIFTNLNLHIPKGQRLAVVGINGAGKTTLVKLMTGLFDVTSGQILINGVDIKQYDKQELYSMFGIVFQDVNILAFSIAQNIACSIDNIDYDRVNKVIDRVGLRKKVDSQPNGVNQMMLKIIEEDGCEMSGGEKQKLAIARALYKDANMVIMDEPTAALDALAEAEIYSEFSQLVSGKTAVYISHRLASTKFCDCIAMFDNDGLIEYGSHDELMKKGGEYYNMFTVQGKYYQDDASGEPTTVAKEGA